MSKATKLIVAVELVNNIIVADVPLATSGKHPKASINGPFIIPPPMPNIPAHNPDRIAIEG